jgi:hypothetical protein
MNRSDSDEGLGFIRPEAGEDHQVFDRIRRILRLPTVLFKKKTTSFMHRQTPGISRQIIAIKTGYQVSVIGILCVRLSYALTLR